NRKARDEMADRTTGLGARVETLNALGYGIVTRAWGRRPPLLEAREQRALVESLVPSRPRRANVDPIAVYIDGLSLIRLGLRDPAEVEAELDGAEGLAAAFDPYRAEMGRREVVDYDEQVYLAIELLLGDGEFRRDRQAEHRHLLVDELQDLTPAHVLLLRLLSAHVALAAAGVPVASILEPDVLDRVGLRAALAYLRIAVTPTAVRGADLVEVQRRPSRALPPWIDKWLSRCRDVASVAAAAD